MKTGDSMLIPECFSKFRITPKRLAVCILFFSLQLVYFRLSCGFTVKVLQTRCLCTWNIFVNKHIKWRQMFSIRYLRRFWLCMHNVMWGSCSHESLTSWWPLFLFHRLSCYTVRTDRSTLFFSPRGFFIQLFFSPERGTTSKIKKTYILDRLLCNRIYFYLFNK